MRVMGVLVSCTRFTKALVLCSLDLFSSAVCLFTSFSRFRAYCCSCRYSALDFCTVCRISVMFSSMNTMLLNTPTTQLGCSKNTPITGELHQKSREAKIQALSRNRGQFLS